MKKNLLELRSTLKKSIVAIDTETNNSLDPLTCKLMGLVSTLPDCSTLTFQSIIEIQKQRLDWLTS